MALEVTSCDDLQISGVHVMISNVDVPMSIVDVPMILSHARY